MLEYHKEKYVAISSKNHKVLLLTIQRNALDFQEKVLCISEVQYSSLITIM